MFLVWVDWKQNLSMPSVHTATSKIFFATGRMECSVFGIVVYCGQLDGPPIEKHIVFLTGIIDHTALMSCVLINELQRHVPGITEAAKLIFGSTAGPISEHWRCVAWPS